MGIRTEFFLLGILALLVASLPPASAAIESCQQYSGFFEQASETYHVPSNLLRAIALTESGCNQSADNGDDCGIMQLNDERRSTIASWLGVSKSSLCAETAEGARLNILGGAALLESYKCYASPDVRTLTDLSACAQGRPPFALTDDEKSKLSSTLEAWWWPIVQYNGGGQDRRLTTTNYPFRVWGWLNDETFGSMFFLTRDPSISYPPLSYIKYFHNGDSAPNSPPPVQYSPSEISSSDDALYPTPSDLGNPGSSGGIRWTKETYNAFNEVVLHRNDGSVYTSVATSPCHLYTSPSEPFPFISSGVPWNVFNPTELVLQAFCSATDVTAQIQKPSSIQYHYTYKEGHQWSTALQRWEAFTFTCTEPLLADTWCPGNASKSLNQANPFFIAYTCSWINNSWKCGCRDQSCTQTYWQLQQFQR